MADQVTPEQAAAEAEKRVRRAAVWQTVSIGVLVIVIVIIFLLFWDPFRGDRTGADAERKPGMVGSIEDLPPSDAYVGIWLKPGTDIDTVLGRHGLDPAGVVFAQTDNGYYVVAVGGRDLNEVVRELKGDASLYDAGNVYQEGPAATSEATDTP